MRNKFKINSAFYSRYTFYDLGFNLRTTEIQGLIGNIQLDFLDEIIKKRRDNFLRMALPIYDKKDKFYPIKYDHIDLLSNFAVPVVCKSKAIRNTLVKKCEGKVEIRPIVGGDMTMQPFFKKYLPKSAHQVNNSNAKLAHEQGLYFGNNPELTNKEMDEIVKIFTGI